jgi:hypothetical protein
MWAQDIGTAVIVCPLAYPGKHVPKGSLHCFHTYRKLFEPQPIMTLVQSLSTKEMLIDPKNAQSFQGFWACNGEKEY